MVSSHDFVREIVLKDSGIVLDATKEYLIDARLAPIVRSAGKESFDALIQTLRTGRAPQLRREIVEAMTTNETTFFRDVGPFELLRTTILPRLIEARRDVRKLKFWYAASSTGQEPYSVAMLIDDAFPELLRWEVEHLATDLSRRSLERAAAGSYSQLEVNRGLPARLLVKYFEKEGASYRISQRIRRAVTFRELNLNARWPWLPTFDVVFLRNVMIYFDVASRRRILGHVHEVLRPDGSLFLGGAETTINLHDRFARVPAANAGCYQPLANAEQ